MKREYCCGIIPLKQIEGEWWVLVVQHRKGDHWSFPKGHQEPGESSWQTAVRELTEETGLRPLKLLFEIPITEQYHIADTNTDKQVDYFIAEVAGDVVQSSEIIDHRWVLVVTAVDILTYPETRALHLQLITLLFSDS